MAENKVWVVIPKMTYKETLLSLFGMLALANSSDTENSLDWQKALDANKAAGFYGRIYDAIECIAGVEILRHWAATGEVDVALANRN